MTLMLFVLAALAFAITLYPLYRSRLQVTPALSSQEEDLRDLHARRDAAYEALKDLEADWQSGGLSEQDYRDLEHKYKTRAVSILKSIDELARTGVVRKEDDEIERRVAQLRRPAGVLQQAGTVEDEIEKRVAQLKQGAAVRPRPASARGNEEGGGAHLGEAKGSAALSNCPRCKAEVRPGVRFCVKCGLNLADLKPVPLCPGCKKEYQKGDRFCARCGTTLPD